MRKHWKLFLGSNLFCLILVMVVVAALPPRFMATGLVRIGFVGPGYGMLNLNSIATEAGSTGFIERVKVAANAPTADMVARVRFESSLVELRAYAPTAKQATRMVTIAADWMVQEHNEIVKEVFAGAMAQYRERFGQDPRSEEVIWQLNSMALDMVEEVKSVKPDFRAASLLALFLGVLLGVVAVVGRELLSTHDLS